MSLLDALARFNDAHPWSHNAHYHPWLLRQLPPRFDRALDVGCGAGDLARLLATRADRVHGIDSDGRIVEKARELTDPGLPVSFTVADGLSYDEGPYDVITCVAVLHHLPLDAALRRLRGQLAPGGTLVVVGLAREDTVVQHLLGLVSVPLNLVTGWIKNRGRAVAGRPVAMTAVTRQPDVPYSELVREVRRVLPGARLRRRLFWRYTLLWTRTP